MIAVKVIDALLPQTQCGECGYAGCLPYAEAMAQGLAPIDRCPPGGIQTLKALGELLAVDPKPYLDSVQANTRAPSVAMIRESECIGCTKCIQACPVDAIIGSAKQMHVILNQDCTGCGLCVEPCPVDCIELIEMEEPLYDPDQARKQFHAKKARMLRDEQDRQEAYREKRRLVVASEDKKADLVAKQDYIQQALARMQAKKNS